ncbi:MAG: DUF1501 domain-containing protein [Verrucomicrobiota bacterium]
MKANHLNRQHGISRREALKRAGAGFGMLALAGLLDQEGLLCPPVSAVASPGPLSPKLPQFKARAKSVIWLFINGGPSQVDTWDYKPELIKRHGQKLDGIDKFTGFFANEVGPLMKSPFAFAQHGQSGSWVSEIFPNLAKHVDKMAFIHSLHTESNNHSPALFAINTGVTRMGFPCVGSWVNYGLGSENQNLPGFVVMGDPLNRGLPKGYAQNWGAGFLPSIYQGTYLRPKGEPIDNLVRAADMSDEQQRAQLDLMAKLNREHLKPQGDNELNARIESFELAYRMQVTAPEAIDLDQEPDHIKELYGLNDKRCSHFAKQCLLARRMVERGVRFVQIYSGGTENQLSWDGHKDIVGNHTGFAGETDQPIAALLTDLEQRGLLDNTLVIWGGEFGRLPISQPADKPGRDHNPHANTVWLAGGGVKGGVHYGETDEIGFKAAVDKVTINDLHATILHLLGMNHEKLTFRYSGRDFRLTDVAGEVVKAVLA